MHNPRISRQSSRKNGLRVLPATDESLHFPLIARSQPIIILVMSASAYISDLQPEALSFWVGWRVQLIDATLYL